MGKTAARKKNTRSSNSESQYMRECKTVIHSAIVKPREFPKLFKTSGKGFKKLLHKYLVDENLMSKKCSWICQSCLDFAKGKHSNSKLTSDVSSASSSATAFNGGDISSPNTLFHDSSSLSTATNDGEAISDFDDHVVKEVIDLLTNNKISCRDLKKSMFRGWEIFKLKSI